MKTKHVYGNIFDSDADAILHQVNCQGAMGSGIAKQVKDRYPVVYQHYKTLCDEHEKQRTRCCLNQSPLLGQIQICYKEDYLVGDPNMDTQAIVNLFAQDGFGRGKCWTDYAALNECLKKVNLIFAGRKVAVPYHMSCCRGGGDWSVVSKMLEDTLVDCDVAIYEYDGGTSDG